MCVAMKEKNMKKCVAAVACLLLQLVIGVHTHRCVLNQNKLKTEDVGGREKICYTL